tara:strand:+ start:7247 stop:8869 length:1623 start_codon:yes stop_codon:yes gene_type:complete
VSIVLFSLSIAGYGSLIKLKNENNFFIDIFLGFTVISFIVTTFHFFFKINFLISLLIFLIGFYIYFKKKNIFLSFKFIKKNIFYVIITFLLIPMFISQKYHEDFGYYHLPYALSFIEEKIIFGFANIDKPFVYNSIWLNLYSMFFYEDKNFDFLTIPSFVLYLTFIFFSLSQIISKKKKLTSDYYLVLVLFYLTLKFTRISEFGVDLPSVIFSILGIYYFIKFCETILENDKKKYFFLIVIFSTFSILIKLSTLPIILLPFYAYLKNFKQLKLSFIDFKFFFIFILLSSFLIQQFVYSGCFFFPTNLTCFNVSWYNTEFLDLSKELELVNKSYSIEAKEIYSPEQYLSQFNWFYFWIKRNFIEISEHLLTIIIPSLLFLFFLKKKNKFDLFFKEKIELFVFLIISLIFWLHFSPVFRFAIHLFVTLAFILLTNLFLSRNFSKKIFIYFISIFILFNFSKNISRIIKVDEWFIGIQKIDNKYVLNQTYSNEFIKIFRPDVENNSQNGWQGRLCWNIPFICSYNKLYVIKKYGYLIVNKLQN